MAEYGRLEYSLLSCYAHGCAVCPGIEEYIFAPLTVVLVMWLALATWNDVMYEISRGFRCACMLLPLDCVALRKKNWLLFPT